MNRVQQYIDKVEKQILQSPLTKEEIQKLSDGLNMSPDEHAVFQNTKSLAVSSQSITVDEGMTIYHQLGGTASVFNKRPLHVKVTLTQIFKELLSDCTY